MSDLIVTIFRPGGGRTFIYETHVEVEGANGNFFGIAIRPNTFQGHFWRTMGHRRKPNQVTKQKRTMNNKYKDLEVKKWQELCDHAYKMGAVTKADLAASQSERGSHGCELLCLIREWGRMQTKFYASEMLGSLRKILKEQMDGRAAQVGLNPQTNNEEFTEAEKQLIRFMKTLDDI